MAKNIKKITLTFIATFLFCCNDSFAQNGIVETIYFKTNSHTIYKNYKVVLDKLAAKCASDTFGFLRILAYTDTAGSEDFNDNLSKQRAYEVYNYLDSHVKFDTSKVYIEWLGKSGEDVLYDLHFPDAHIQQRCVDILVTFRKKELIKKTK